MNIKKIALLTVAVSALASCANLQNERLFTGQIIKEDVIVDNAPSPTHQTTNMRAGIWIDGNGCEHWIIDDGIEGYMSPRWGKNGLPLCSANNTPYTTRDFNRSMWGSNSVDNYN